MVEIVNIFIQDSIFFEISRYLLIEDLVLLKSSCLILKNCDWKYVWIKCLKRDPYRFYNIIYLSALSSNQVEIHAIHTAKSLKTLLKAIQIEQHKQQLIQTSQSSQSSVTKDANIETYHHEVDLLWVLARLNNNSLLRNSFGFIDNSLNWMLGFLNSLTDSRNVLLSIWGSNIAQNNYRQIPNNQLNGAASAHLICDFYFLVFDLSQQYLEDDIQLIDKCIIIMTEALKYFKAIGALGTRYLTKSRNEAVIDGLMKVIGYYRTSNIALFKSICDIFVIFQGGTMWLAYMSKIGVCNLLIHQLFEFHGDAEQYLHFYAAGDLVLHSHAFVATKKYQDPDTNWKYVLNLDRFVTASSCCSPKCNKVYFLEAGRQLNWLKFTKAHMFQPEQLEFIFRLTERISSTNDMNGTDHSL